MCGTIDVGLFSFHFAAPSSSHRGRTTTNFNEIETSSMLRYDLTDAVICMETSRGCEGERGVAVNGKGSQVLSVGRKTRI